MARRRTTPGSADVQLELALLGGWSARAAGRPLELPTKKSQALLAYLALRAGRPHERDTLRALLWPESPKLHAQASLRQALLALRKALPSALHSALLISSSSVALDPARICLDVHTLQRQLAEPTRAALERAAGLCGGPLLDGFTLGEAPFEEWLEAERARINDLMLGALERLVELLAHERDLERALQTALRALRLEPLQERAHRSIMRLYALQGRRAEAVQHYEQCAALLARELGVEPDPQTKRLHRELLDTATGAPEVALSVAPRTVADVRLTRDGPRELARARPCVGRETELAWLEQALAAAAAGEGGLAVLHGDAGIGKTRLLDALAGRVRTRGWRCVRGRCFESEQVLPFALWADLLRSDPALTHEAALRGLPAAYRTELARLLPSAAESVEPAPLLADPRRLFEALSELLLRAAGQSVLLVLLEDLHWADSMSLRLLSFLVRRASSGGRVRMVGTVRAEELSSAPDLRRTLHELGREQRLRERTLAPLARSDALALIATLRPSGGANLDARVSEQIWTLSEGNPLVIVESVRGLSLGARPLPAPQLAVPERVRALVEQHVERLSALARDALVTAAVIGREFDFALLACACGVEVRALALAIEELVQRRLLESTGTGLYFTHDRIREVLYAALLPARRAVLHGAVARALEQVCAERLDELAGTIGYHYARAAQADASVAFLLRFARHSARNYGLEEALAALDEGQRQSACLPSPLRDPRALELAIVRCHCLLHLGRVAEVEAALAPVRSSVERLNMPALTAPFHAWLALAKGFLGEGPATVDHGTRALAEAERCGDLRSAGLAHSVLALEASRSGQFQRGIAHGLRAVEVLDPETTDHEFAAFARMHLGVNYLSVGACATALESFTQAHAIGERVHSTRLCCLALGFCGLTRVAAAEFEAGLPACRQALELAPDPHSTWMSQLIVVRAFPLAAVASGDAGVLREPAYAASVEALEASLRASGSPSMRAFVGRAMITLADAYLAQQQPERARQMARSALAPLQNVDDPLGLAAAQRVQGQAALALGDLDEAAARIGEARRACVALGARLEGTLVGLSAALVALLRGDAPSAAQELALAEQAFTALQLPRWVALVRARSGRPAA